MSFLNLTSKLEKVMGKEVELLEAARTGNLATVEKLLTSKGKKSHVGGASIGQKLTSFLKSVNVNYTDKNGYTALHHAAVNGYRDIVEVLLKADAQPGIVDSQGCTPVHLAAWNGDAEVVMQLLTAGHDSDTGVDPVSINQQNGTGDTALHCAAQYGHVAVVDVLLNKSAAPTVRNLEEASPLDLAAQYGRLEVVQRLLISHPELAHHPSSTQSPLHLASRNGHRDIVAVLLDNNFDIQTVTENGSALHESALHGKLDVVKLLLERGIDINHRDQKQLTVLELLGAHKSQQKMFTQIMQAIQSHTGQAEQDSGIYDSLTNCRSGTMDKPTAAVKPLPPENSSQSETPLTPPPDKPHPPADKPLPPPSSDKPHPPDEIPLTPPSDKPVPRPRKSLSCSPEEEKPVIPLYSKPNKDSFKKVDRVESAASSIIDDTPPPLPPRTSIFAVPDQPAVSPPQTEPVGTDVTEKSPKSTMPIPKKPPRQKKSPLSVRKTPDKPATDITPPTPPQPETFENIPINKTDIPTTQSDILKIDSTQNATQSTVDQSHSSSVSAASADQSDCSITHSFPSQGPKVAVSADKPDIPNKNEISEVHSQTLEPVSPQPASDQADDSKRPLSPSPSLSVKNKPKLSPKPALPRRPTIPKPKEDNSVDPVMGKQVKQPFYMEMTGKQTTPPPKPVSEVKPHIKVTPVEETAKDINITPKKTDLKPTQPKEDNYGMLFQNLKKDPKKNLQRPEFKRTNTAPEEAEYVKHHPVSPTDKFKDKQVLKRANTAPEETYVPMNNPKKEIDRKDDKLDQRCEEPKENEYSEIPEKLGPPLPIENVYATISETKAEKSPTITTPDAGNVYERIADVKQLKSPATPPPPMKGAKPADPKVSPKPNYLEFMKNKPNTPLTPTGYPQPPTPDFPPPSPATAMMGIELKIQQIDTKRKSRDITTLTDDTLASIQEHKSEVKVTAEVKVSESEKITEVKEGNKVEESSKSAITVRDSKENIESSKVELKSDSPSANSDNKEKVVATETEESEYEVLYKCKSVIKDTSTKDIPESSISPKPTKPVIETKVVSDKSATSESAKTDKSEPTSDKIEPLPDKSKQVSEKSEPVSDTVTKVKDTVAKVKNMEGGASDSGSHGDSGGASPVVMRKKSINPDMDVFKGLLRGSTIGGPPKVCSQFYKDVIRQSRIKFPDSAPPIKPSTMDKEVDIDVDQVMKSIDVEVAKRASASDAGNFDDSEEWAKIADIMSSFGGNLTTFTSPTYSPSEEEFNVAFESYMDTLLSKRERGSGQMISVGEWLESVGLPQYENAFVANGYDNIDFLDHEILEEGDLEQIGVLSHDHRQTLLHATRSLPQLQPIDPNSPPPSVEEWLLTLQLLDYLETFRSHGYDTMEKVQSILWELQLRTVLDISMLGHRKRILTSLGERKPQGSQKKRSISSLSPEETRSPFNNIDLFKDYTHVKPVSSSEEDIKESVQMVIDSSEDEDVFKKQHGQSIRNSNIHLRPPHLAQTSSPARQWRHKPEMLIKGCCNYTAQYLGSTVVPELTGGTESTRAGITKLKLRFLRQLQKSADILAKIPIIMLSISYKGVKFIDAKSKKVICDHEIGNIFCACQDTDNLNFFAYITRDIQTGQHYCHVFSVKSSSLAHDIILTLGESFEVAYQMALKEKSAEEAMELDRKMSQSDPEDAYSTKSSLSTNTV